MAAACWIRLFEIITAQQYLLIEIRWLAFIHADEIVEPGVTGKNMVGLNKIFDRQLPVGCNFKLHCFAEMHSGQIVALEFGCDRFYAGEEVIGSTAQINEHPVMPGDTTNLDQIGTMAFTLVDVMLLTAMEVWASD